MDTGGRGGRPAVRLHQEAPQLPAGAAQATGHRSHGQGQYSVLTYIGKVQASGHKVKFSILLLIYIINVQKWSRSVYSVLTCNQGTDLWSHGQGQYTLYSHIGKVQTSGHMDKIS